MNSWAYWFFSYHFFHAIYSFQILPQGLQNRHKKNSWLSWFSWLAWSAESQYWILIPSAVFMLFHFCMAGMRDGILWNHKYYQSDDCIGNKCQNNHYISKLQIIITYCVLQLCTNGNSDYLSWGRGNGREINDAISCWDLCNNF